VLHGEHPVQRHPCGADDRAAWLDGKTWHRDAPCGAFALDHAGDPLGESGDVQAVLAGPVGYGVTAAEIQLGQASQSGHEGDQAAGGRLEAIQAGDLRADVAVHASQFQGGLAEDVAGNVRGRARGNRQAELLVLGAGCHRRVHVRVDPRSDPDQDLLPSVGQRRELPDLTRGVNDDPANAVVERG
jgi:hypothetical protein